MIERIKRNFARPLVIEYLFGHPGIQGERLFPVGLQPLVAGMQARVRQAGIGLVIRAVHIAGHMQAAPGAAPLVYHALLIRDDQYVVTATIFIGHYSLLRPGCDD